MAKSNLQEKLASDKEYQQLTKDRDKHSKMLRNVRQTLNSTEDGYTFSLTACGVAAATALTCFSLTAPIMLYLGGVAALASGYACYTAVRLFTQLGGLRRNADQLQTQYEQSRDAVRDYVLSNIKTNGLSETSQAPEQQPQQQAEQASAKHWQDKMGLQQLAEALVSRK